MKGITFTANVIIVIAVGIIVMLGVIALFYPTFSSGGQSVSADSAKNAACNVLVSKRCKELTKNIQVANFDADRDGTIESTADGDNLLLLCHNYYGIECQADITADVNRDCIVDSNDINLISHVYWHLTPADPDWNPYADVDPDNLIDVFDVLATTHAPNWGNFDLSMDKTCKKLCGCATM